MPPAPKPFLGTKPCSGEHENQTDYSSVPWFSLSVTPDSLFVENKNKKCIIFSSGRLVNALKLCPYFTADRCSPESSFRHEVLSHFVRIVNDLLNKRLFSLLVPTVRLWATDVVDVAISVNGSVDKKVM